MFGARSYAEAEYIFSVVCIPIYSINNEIIDKYIIDKNPSRPYLHYHRMYYLWWFNRVR